VAKRLRQLDQTFCEKNAQFCRKIAQNGASINKDFLPEEINDQPWKFKHKK
jgi:hypothetical protein